ncbi:Uncharacterised protein [Mycobacteroides abscessus subsp. massiliense]|uniref:hypothetical protein n=1 Tax=Mycobacteroides abscessus TaxID=36809 RepID=UPI0009A73CB6|nr:hypothetical protein [Mycobacteroides abscessus]SLC04734.1 Uncharacterised protein [Mycobacteroides abscessus subsp. massiliense]
MTHNPDVYVCTGIQCECGGATTASTYENKTVHTCLGCGKWVATTTLVLADGAMITDSSLPVDPA